jgi:hypothetical protein
MKISLCCFLYSSGSFHENLIILVFPHVLTGHKEKMQLILVPGHYRLKEALFPTIWAKMGSNMF